ncbi:MAG: DUF2288 domain-containing protein [Neisseria sp.]|nr:DUF2288 domain-containing protein [Neisseria sp.]
MHTFTQISAMTEPLLNEKINTETAKIAWSELQTHFARGAAVYVHADLDLIATARLFADDDSSTVAKLMQQGQIHLVSESQAAEFYQNNQQMWAVVIAPWVLIQEVK